MHSLCTYPVEAHLQAALCGAAKFHSIRSTASSAAATAAKAATAEAAKAVAEAATA